MKNAGARLEGMTVRGLIEQRAEQDGEQVFLICPASQKEITYSQLLKTVQRVAANVNARGIQPGESVAYAMTNGHDCSVIILGLLYGGYRATAVNLVAGASTIGYVIEHSQTRLIITQSEQEQLLDDALAGVSDRPLRIHANQILNQQEHGGIIPDSGNLNENSDGLLMYTSGTTGRPKGVVLTHKSLIAGGCNTVTAHELEAKDRALCVLPLYHINGLCVTLMGPLVSAGSVVVPEKFSTSLFWQQIKDHACTWFSVVPTQISYLLHATDTYEPDGARAKVRFGRSASAPLSPDVQNAFEKRFNIPIIETMGLTETAAQILSNPLPPATRKTGSPGIAIGNQVIIADEQQRQVSCGTEGEVLVRGANVMQRYLKNEEATNEALMPDGWLRTGDLGRMDSDGYVFITGRLKELIIKGGENIAPREIDEALYAHADIVEAAAFACPCKNYGQRVEAAVRVSESSTVTEQELLDFCRQRLGPVKTPDKIHFLPELPKGPSGKIQRVKIAELLEVSG